MDSSGRQVEEQVWKAGELSFMGMWHEGLGGHNTALRQEAMEEWLPQLPAHIAAAQRAAAGAGGMLPGCRMRSLLQMLRRLACTASLNVIGTDLEGFQALDRVMRARWVGGQCLPGGKSPKVCHCKCQLVYIVLTNGVTIEAILIQHVELGKCHLLLGMHLSPHQRCMVYLWP